MCDTIERSQTTYCPSTIKNTALQKILVLLCQTDPLMPTIVCPPPAATATTSRTAGCATTSGYGAESRVPWPNCPCSPQPHVATHPLSRQQKRTRSANKHKNGTQVDYREAELCAPIRKQHQWLAQAVIQQQAARGFSFRYHALSVQNHFVPKRKHFRILSQRQTTTHRAGKSSHTRHYDTVRKSRTNFRDTFCDADNSRSARLRRNNTKLAVSACTPSPHDPGFCTES